MLLRAIDARVPSTLIRRILKWNFNNYHGFTLRFQEASNYVNIPSEEIERRVGKSLREFYN